MPIRWLTRFRRLIRDARRPEKYTALHVAVPQPTEKYTALHLAVPQPTHEAPWPCILVTLSTGPRNRVLFRLRDLAAWDAAFILTEETRERLERQLAEARAQAAELIEDDRLAMLRRQGVGLARMDTGEIIAEAENIMREEK